MSIRQNKSTTNLPGYEQEFSDPLLGNTSVSDPQQSVNTSSKKPNKSTVLDLGFDYWNGSQGSGSVLGSVTSNYGPYKPPYSYRMGNSKISINRPLATAIIVITLALFFLTVVAYSRKIHGRRLITVLTMSTIMGLTYFIRKRKKFIIIHIP